MSKSPVKKINAPEEFKFLPRDRTPTRTKERVANNIVCCAYIDRNMKDVNFFDKKTGAPQIKMAAPNKHNVYEKSQASGEILQEFRGNFDEIYTGDKPERFLTGLARMTTSSNDRSFSILVMGIKDKITIAQLIIRLFMDQIASTKLMEFFVTGSDAFCNSITHTAGNVFNRQANTMRVDSDRFAAFSEAVDSLDKRAIPEEFYFSIEYTRNTVSEPQYICFAGTRLYEELRKYNPIKKTDADKALFVRKLLQTNFRDSETSAPLLGLFIDRFMSYPLRMIFNYSHLVRDYLNDQFLTELSSCFANNQSQPAVQVNARLSTSPMKQALGMEHASLGGDVGSSARFGGARRDENERTIDDKVKEASAHVKNLFKFMQ
jgi:hypothetical protein